MLNGFEKNWSKLSRISMHFGRFATFRHSKIQNIGTMQRRIYFVFSTLICFNIYAQTQTQATAKWGTERMRYEFFLTGNATSETASCGNIVMEPHWGGSLDQLIDPLGYGTYRYQIFDAETNDLLMSKGFSPLFWEWQTTAEAQHKIRTFEQAVFFPKPLIPIILKIEKRNTQNEWLTLLSDTLKANNKLVVADTPVKFESVSLIKSGESADKIDLLIVAEGYTAQERQLFIDDAQRITDSLFACQPFAQYKNRFNVNALVVPSVESGTDLPHEGTFKNTALNSSFNTFDSERYLTTLAMRNVYNAAAAEPWDHIIILVNSTKYGGGGCYNFQCISTARNELSAFVTIHEFGHAFAGLGDEYYTSSTSYENFYSKTFEPWEPNLTALVQFDTKWKQLMDKSTPIPTPRIAEYETKVGVFEGGGYEAKGIYSPAQTCWMKEFKAGAFCKVCQAAIENMILKNSLE